MSTTQSKISYGTAPSSPQIGHDVDTVLTLPDAKMDTSQKRPVMWHGPNPIGLGARSAVPKTGVQAWDVTDGGQPPAGATLAGAPGVHSTQLSELQTLSFVQSLSSQIGDESHTNSFHSVNTSMDFAEWRRRVMQFRHGGSLLETEAAGDSIFTDEQAKKLVKLARDLMSLHKVKRNARKDTAPSPKTLADYKKKCKQIDREMKAMADECDPLAQVMGRHAVKKQTFTAFKSALKSRSINAIQDLLRSQDALQRAEQRGFSWKQHVMHLMEAMRDFVEIDGLDRDECLIFTGHVARLGHSKRRDLPYLPAGWQERFLDMSALDSQFRDVGVLLLHCGLRPVELLKGVKVRRTPEGISVHIQGGKVRETAGQPWRSFVLDPETLPESFVHRVQINGEITVSADPELLRAYLYRLSDRVFLQGKYRPQGAREKSFVLSAYTFRHSVVTALRDSGWDTKSIAAAIGESSAQTVSLYGTRSRVGSRSPQKSSIMKNSVQAARPVRGVDMKGLHEVLSRKANTVKKKAHLHPRLSP